MLLIFDTDCVLCSGGVHFVLARERDRKITFVGAWSPTGLKLAAEHGLSRDDLQKTFLVIRDGQPLVRSDAALAVAPHLRRPWNWCHVLRFVPRPLRDAVYDLVAKHRYQWFGRRDNCFVPPPEMQERFVND